MIFFILAMKMEITALILKCILIYYLNRIMNESSKTSNTKKIYLF